MDQTSNSQPIVVLHGFLPGIFNIKDLSSFAVLTITFSDICSKLTNLFDKILPKIQKYIVELLQCGKCVPY